METDCCTCSVCTMMEHIPSWSVMTLQLETCNSRQRNSTESRWRGGYISKNWKYQEWALITGNLIPMPDRCTRTVLSTWGQSLCPIDWEPVIASPVSKKQKIDGRVTDSYCALIGAHQCGILHDGCVNGFNKGRQSTVWCCRLMGSWGDRIYI